MKSIKSIFLIGLCLLMANCELTGSDANDVVTLVEEPNKEEVGDPTPKETNFYTGSTKKIHYYVGGWFPAPGTPNYRIDLELTVNSQGLIDGDLDTPECQVKKPVDAKDYAKLIDLIQAAELIRTSNGFRIDGGVNQVQLTNDESAVATYYVRRSDGESVPLMVDTDAEKVEAQIDVIVEKMEEGDLCSNPGDSEISSFYYKEDLVRISAANNKMANYPAGSPTVRRNFEIVNLGDRLEVSGTETDFSNSLRLCTKSFSGKKISNSLINDMEAIKFTTRKVVCMYMPQDIVVFGKLMTNDYFIEGSPGCHSTVGVTKHEAFQKKFLEWLRKQPATCRSTTNI